MKHIRFSGLAAAALLSLAACGGGGDTDTTPRAHITSLKVMGDSLADEGTFGIKFTAGSTASQIYPDRVAQTYGLSALCNFYAFNGATFVANPTVGCTNYAIAGSRINYPSQPGISPQIVRNQLQTSAAVGSTYRATDLVLIDGGGNDIADVITAYLTAAGGGGTASYVTLLDSLLDPTLVSTTLGQTNGSATVGVYYMTALADTFYNQIKTNVLDNGATHVAVLNMPAVTKTPRLQAALDSVATAAGGGANGAAARAGAEGLFITWIQTFNTELANKFAGNSSVVVVDFYGGLLDVVNNPSQYGITNVTTPACPLASMGSDGLLNPASATPCSVANLAATLGHADPNWWTTYGFSDTFHPTPAVHRLIGQLIAKSLATAGWL